MNKSVLFITSIYSNLWGTEFGGRASRYHHYRESLLNILKTKPTKCICFTSRYEHDDLCDYFYNKKEVSRDILDIRVFNLYDTKYFENIRKKKDIDKMKSSDRCYEIQYNKFFWFDLIENPYQYDRVYWIDSGLSHGGLFPPKYRRDKKYYDITLFTPNIFDKFNEEIGERILLLSKNNSGRFFWSQSLPKFYFDNFNRERHIVGGLFGGTPEMYQRLRLIFEDLLTKLLYREDELYMEEQIMTCIYYNNKELFLPKEFDDWYRRNPDDSGIKYFYKIFE